MAFTFRKAAQTADQQSEHEHSGGWYSDPYGVAARRWYDSTDGWTDRVEGAGLDPEKTGITRVDEANAPVHARTEHSDLDGTPTAMPGGRT